MKKNIVKHPNPHNCRVCNKGACCAQGVEVDLFEVARILKKPLNLKKPWFYFMGPDKEFPSGFNFSTTLRNGRCVFQDSRFRCRIYEIRPRYCAEFPFENGKKAPYYHALCHHMKKSRKK